MVGHNIIMRHLVYLCWFGGGVVCLHDSVLTLQLPEVLVGCGVALVQVEVD